MKRFITLLEAVGGATRPPRSWRRGPAWLVVTGLWWTVMLLTALAFMGRGTKFIYVDF